MSTDITGGCHCGAVRYMIRAAPRRVSVCHCADCRRCAGAPMVGWAAVRDVDLEVRGTLARYQSSAAAHREFCPNCGTGLFYRNAELFPDEVDVSTGTLDDPNAFPPQEAIQLADAPDWLSGLPSLPGHARFPPEG